MGEEAAGRDLRRYTGTILVNLLALVLVSVLQPASAVSRLLPSLLAVMLASWYGGRLPGLLAAAATTWVSSYALITEIAQGTSTDPNDLTRLWVYALAAMLVSEVNSARSAEARAESARQAAERHRQSLHELLDLERRCRALAEAAEVGSFQCDLQGRLTAADEQWIHITGAAPRESPGLDWHEVFLKEDRPSLTACWHRMRETKRPCSLEVRLRKPGESLKTILLRASPILDDVGGITGFAGTITDITHLRRVEEEVRRAESVLRTQQDLTRAITHSLAEGVCAVDRQGSVLMVNPAAERMLGWSEQELLGRDLHAMLHPQENTAANGGCHVLKALGAGGVLRSIETSFMTRDGSLLSVECSFSPISNGRESVGSVLAFHDITLRKREEAALRRLSEQRAHMVATVSHALRAPVAAMLVNFDVLAAEVPGELTEQQKEYVERAAESAAELGKTLDDLLALSRLQSGHVTPQVSRVDAAALARTVHTQMLPAARAREVSLNLEAPESALFVQTDSHQLRNMLVELIENGTKYTEPGGAVSVSVRPSGREVMLEVADTGSGIAPEELDRLYDAFYRGASARRRQIPGSGLGLSIVKQEAELLGLHLEVETEPDRGSLFRLRLPIGEPAETPPV